MPSIIKSIKEWFVRKTCSYLWEGLFFMVTPPTTYLASITEAIQPWLPFGYCIIIAIVIILILSIKYLIQKNSSTINGNIFITDIVPTLIEYNDKEHLVLISMNIFNTYKEVVIGNMIEGVLTVNTISKPKPNYPEDMLLLPYNSLPIGVYSLPLILNSDNLDIHIKFTLTYSLLKNRKITYTTKQHIYEAKYSLKDNKIANKTSENCIFIHFE